MEKDKERWVKVILTDQEKGQPKISIKSKDVNGIEILGLLSVGKKYYNNRVDKGIKNHRIKALEKELEEYKNKEKNV